MVAIAICLNLLDRLTGARCGDLSQFLLHAQDQIRVNANIRCATARASQRLVEQNTSVRGDVALSGSACSQQELPHRCCKAHADGDDIRLHVLHGVVDSHTGGHGTTRRVNVQVDIAFGIFCSQQKELRTDRVCVIVSHLATEPDDALFQQALVDRISQSHGRFISARGLNSHSRSPYKLRVRFHS